MNRSVLTWALCLTFGIVACGETDGNGSDDSGPGEPLDLSETTFGVTFHHGEAGILEKGDDVDQDVIDGALDVAGAGFLDLQSYDEHTWQFGEWEVYPPPDGEDYRRSGVFRNEPKMARFEQRVGDLADEVETTFGEFGGGGFDQKGVIFDVWRMRDDWYVRWDGNLDTESNKFGKGEYGFYRADMTDDLVSQLDTAADQEGFDYLVIGDDMGRLLGRRGEPGLAPDDFSNFRQFYRKVVETVREDNPSTRVGAGFDWDRFARHVAPAFGEGEPGEVPPRETLREAFEAVLFPLAKSGRLLALKSYRPPSGDAEHYEFLADLDEMFDMEGVSVIWYSVGSPVEMSVSYRKQRSYLENFIEWNRGIEPDLIVWRSLLNVDGADLGNQEIGGRCRAMVDEKMFKLDRSHCFDGLFTTGFQPKGVFELISEESSGGGE